MTTTPTPGAVQVCPDRDIECGNNSKAWCAKCPKHGAETEAPYRIAEFWSSASPGTKVRMLAGGSKISEWSKRSDFIRWVDSAVPAPVSGMPDLAKRLADNLEILDARPRPMCRDCADEDGTCPTTGLACSVRALIAEVRALLNEMSAQPEACTKCGRTSFIVKLSQSCPFCSVAATLPAAPAPTEQADDYTLDDVDLARRLLTEMGRAISPSREPGANRDVDRLAALIGANFAARQAPTEAPALPDPELHRETDHRPGAAAERTRDRARVSVGVGQTE